MLIITFSFVFKKFICFVLVLDRQYRINNRVQWLRCHSIENFLMNLSLIFSNCLEMPLERTSPSGHKNSFQPGTHRTIWLSNLDKTCNLEELFSRQIIGNLGDTGAPCHRGNMDSTSNSLPRKEEPRKHPKPVKLSLEETKLPLLPQSTNVKCATSFSVEVLDYISTWPHILEIIDIFVTCVIKGLCSISSTKLILKHIAKSSNNTRNSVLYLSGLSWRLSLRFVVFWGGETDILLGLFMMFSICMTHFARLQDRHFQRERPQTPPDIHHWSIL